MAKVWGNPEYLQLGWRGRLRNALLDRATYLDTLKMDDAALAAFAAPRCGAASRRSSSDTLTPSTCSPSTCAAMGSRHPARAASSRRRWCCTTGSGDVIEEVFGCPVTNRYGCEEVSLIACECERHRGLARQRRRACTSKCSRDGRPAAAGEPGSIVVTDLTNRAMPLLRYQVGDVAVLVVAAAAPAAAACRCWSAIEGREADYVVTADGRADLRHLADGELRHARARRGPDADRPGDADAVPLPHRARRGLRRRRAASGCTPWYASGSGRIREFELRNTWKRSRRKPSGKYRFCISRVPVEI